MYLEFPSELRKEKSSIRYSEHGKYGIGWQRGWEMLAMLEAH